MERRSTPTPVKLTKRNDDEVPKIRGIAARYYDASDPGTQFELWPGVVERIHPGAFDKAAKRDDVVALFNHDPNLLLGRRSAKTLKLFLRADGLHYHVEPPDTSAGRDVVASIGRGDVRGSSFAFRVTDEDWSKETTDGDELHVRNIRGVELFDVSPVTYPAYTATSVGLRSTGPIAEARSSFEAWQRHESEEAEKIAAQRRTDEARVRLAQIA